MSARPRRAAAEAALADAPSAATVAGRKRGRAAAAAAINYNEDSAGEEEEDEEEAVAVERPPSMSIPSTSIPFNAPAALRRLRARWPGRDQQLIALLSALGGPGDRAPHMLVHGPQATGKTSIVR
jgi:hypothetical protein